MVNAVQIKNLDEVDKQILKLLQENAKISLRDMEKEINLSTTSIRLRIKSLEKQNIIKDYITLIDCHQLGYKEMVIASLRVNTSQSLEEIRKKLNKMEEIKYAYIVTGEYPLFISFKCLDHEDAMKLIEKLRNLPGVEEVKTQIVLDKIKEDPRIIIPE
ncbi:MAG: Lrp/AsnC family transcriptional regulator [Candidatus Lokiarchaeota archaeon]